MALVTSVQHFEITIAASSASNTATISSVTTGRSLVLFAGFHAPFSGTTTYRDNSVRVDLTNGTTVTARRDQAAAGDIVVRGCVVEFDSAAVASVQQGTIAVANSAASGTATISSVTTGNAVAFYLGATIGTGTSSPANVFPRIDLTNATTVTANRVGTSGAVTVGYCVVEFASGVLASNQPRSVTFATGLTSGTDTLPTSVNTGRTVLVYQGASCTLSTENNWFYRIELTNTNTVTLTRGSTSTTSRTINYTALEFASGYIDSIQRGTTAIASGATGGTTTITSVTTSRAALFWGHFTPTTTTDEQVFAATRLSNGTTVASDRSVSGSNANTSAWEVVEFTAGASNPVLTADAGAYSLSGKAANLLAGRKLAANAGAYALSGNAAVLLHGYPLAAASGTYTLSGKAATLEADRVLAAARGTYTLTGIAAGLYRAYPLAAGAGTYTLTGAAASLKATRVLTATAGAYTLSGRAAGLLTGRVLTAGLGTYALTGHDAALIYSPAGAYTLTADAGGYTLTGQAAGLRAGRTLPAGTGSYALTGSDATLDRTRRLSAGAGVYSVAGGTATLTVHRVGPVAQEYGGWPNRKDDRTAAPDWMVQRAQAHRARQDEERRRQTATPSEDELPSRDDAERAAREARLRREITEARAALRVAEQTRSAYREAERLRALLAEQKALTAARREADRRLIEQAVEQARQRDEEDAFFLMLAA